jgi:hypothetical protein
MFLVWLEYRAINKTFQSRVLCQVWVFFTIIFEIFREEILSEFRAGSLLISETEAVRISQGLLFEKASNLQQTE